MALIKCNECGHEISDKASACPNCGYPIEKGSVCNECGTTINETDEVCPNRGCPQNKNQTAMMQSIEEVGIKRYNVSIPAIVGIATYIVSTTLLSNLLDHGVSGTIENDIILCGLVAIIITSVIAKSNLDRYIYGLVIIGVSWVAYKNWEILSYGTAVIVFITEISLILVAAIKRNHPSKLGHKTMDIIDWCFALSIAIPLMFCEFMVCVSILYGGVNWLYMFTGVIGGLSNFVYMQWVCEKKVHSLGLQSRILYFYKFILIGIAVTGLFVGYLLDF